VDDSPPFETQLVVWLQAGEIYADLRVPIHAAARDRCFAGRSGWQGESFRWEHRLDLEDLGGEDIGSLRWEQDVLIEEGMFPTQKGPVRYAEAWARLDGADGASFAQEEERGCRVRAGRHEIDVVDERPTGRFRGTYRRLTDEGWRVVAEVTG
jgi:hypothetical protein